jgi:hypothetical protein
MKTSEDGRPPMLTDQQSENGYTTESNLYVPYNPHQNANELLQR